MASESSSSDVSNNASSSNHLLILSYIALFSIWAASNYILIPVSFNLITTSTLIIYIGSHRSLRLLIKGDNAITEKETLTATDAYKFPFIGSAALFSLYAAFKYLDKYYVNLLLSIYFSIVGIFTLTSTLAPFIKQIVPSSTIYGKIFNLPFLGKLDLTLTLPEIIALIPSSIFAYYYFITKHFILNNVLGISFCIQAIERISIGSYKIGSILLVGLFFYDIFWVFGTEVMVTVAKSFDGPIKLLFPRVFANGDVKAEFSLLGLGDIVIPGLFISLLLRLDATKALLTVDSLNNAEYSSFKKHYFYVNIFAYALGLIATVGVMYFFNAAQPALLYLVPACLIGSSMVGLWKGEFMSVLWAYAEEDDKKKEGEDVKPKSD